MTLLEVRSPSSKKIQLCVVANPPQSPIPNKLLLPITHYQLPIPPYPLPIPHYLFLTLNILPNY
ncbi:hypothetical protein NIES37_43860 [Tolypothrix tenuis PCC 7101]|uniref:Uncharacterized protein n=1 Tax=Tolypothrix tenuis PCC 7101 TaxID=231146 RepID=A0A1Z4N3Y2_9CYAN|nr:hypothetical protein NIES37_43860 [Tolypothrix tenuis PCC 7101]BAZ75684.1 hypothetical protein NIES50_42730 [Aulosira laxa NIES-50]